MEPSTANTISVIDQNLPQTAKLTTADTAFANPSVYMSSASSSCMQCRIIDMELNVNTLHYSTATMVNTPSDYLYLPRMSKNEWQVANSSRSAYSNCQSLKSIECVPDIVHSIEPCTEIDTTSFIVVRDDPAKYTPSPTEHPNLLPVSHFKSFNKIPYPQQTPEINSQQKCSDCCFCNPDLHKRSRSISSSCSYCNRLNEKWNSYSQQDLFRNKSTNTKPQQFFETQSKTDHTHIRTRSKDSDTVSLKCTRVNTKLHRYLPEDILNGNVFEETENLKDDKNMRSKCPQNATDQGKVPVTIPPMKVTTPNGEPKQKNSFTNNPQSATKSFRLPSPFINNAIATSTHCYDILTSPSSSQCSSSVSSSPVSTKKISTNRVGQWQNHNSAGVPSTREANLPAIRNNHIRKSRYQHFYGNSKSSLIEDKPDEARAQTGPNKMSQASVNQQNSGKCI